MWSLAAAVVFSATVAPPAPNGWREPTAVEVNQAQQEARKSGGPAKLRFKVSADVDGDGRPDMAVILLNERTGVFAPFIKRASVGRLEKLADGGPIATLWNHTLDILPPGVHQTACGRGHDSAGPCRAQVRNRWPAIGLSAHEASYEIFFWDGRRFDSESLTD